MLTELFKKKSNVARVVEDAKARLRTLQAEREQALARLKALEREREELKRRVFDEKARALLAEDRRPLEEELARLQARLPLLEAELTELQSELLPRLEQALAEAERAVKTEVLRVKKAKASQAGEGREAILRAWNEATARMLSIAEEAGRFNGRLEHHRRQYEIEARGQRQPVETTGEPIPVGLLRALQAALGEAWQRGYEAGEREAGRELTEATRHDKR